MAGASPALPCSRYGIDDPSVQYHIKKPGFFSFKRQIAFLDES